MNNNIDSKVCLLWTGVDSHEEFIVGMLTKSQKLYTFEYFIDEAEAASKEGFDYVPTFPDLDKFYESAELFPFFASRVFGATRKDIGEILKNYDLEKYDRFELLKKTHGLSMNDNYSVAEIPEQSLNKNPISPEEHAID